MTHNGKFQPLFRKCNIVPYAAFNKGPSADINWLLSGCMCWICVSAQISGLKCCLSKKSCTCYWDPSSCQGQSTVCQWVPGLRDGAVQKKIVCCLFFFFFFFFFSGPKAPNWIIKQVPDFSSLGHFVASLLLFTQTLKPPKSQCLQTQQHQDFCWLLMFVNDFICKIALVVLFKVRCGNCGTLLHIFPPIF